LFLPLIKFCLAIIEEDWLDGSEASEQKGNQQLQKAQRVMQSWSVA
jgi:hypothetical protein